ncbi:DNA repair protein XRCC2-like [Neocloeon triangulifer]|uniref:DNA repair protein XRCC2-like n=1 Tax=Neocloeon triangulifer TaxID=2078957 RepID=UPI00286F732B|nr:DNA repair protein XRCC2-like [Neocloeon triangulifer]XP_059472819.1 DNA repair protein XRCC2-like [Neocloeon triangulifer]
MTSPSIRAESGLQMLSRLSGCTGSSVSDLQPALFPSGLLNPHDVVEVRSPEGNLSTRLCSHLLARCVLPMKVGGLEAEAIFIDTEHQLRIQHFASALETTLRKSGMERKEMQKALKAALNQLLILQCFNSTQLLASIHTLPQLIRSRPNKVSLVVIDSPAAYYQSDLLFEGNANTAKVSKDYYLATFLSPLLSSEIKQLNIVLVFTLPVNYKKSFVETNYPNRSFSLFVKPEVKQASEASSAEDNNTPNCFQVIMHRGKDYVLQTMFSLTENQLIWEKESQQDR